MQRIQTVDVIKVLAIFAVITIHTKPFELTPEAIGSTYSFLEVLINQLSRFAVPFFFVVSGFFWGRKIRQEELVVKVSFHTMLRIGGLFLFWSLIFLLPYNMSLAVDGGWSAVWENTKANFLWTFENPIRPILYGTKYHLWFLSALIFAIVISSTFLFLKWEKILYVFTGGLFLLGLIGGAYKETMLGMDVGLNTRNGPFLSSFLFAIGYYLSAKTPDKSWYVKGLWLIFIGAAIHFSEILLLEKFYQMTLMPDYVFGTLIMGLGVSLVALSNHERLISDRLSSIGKLSLGLYAVHVIFVDNLGIIDKQIDHIAWEVGYPVIVFILSWLSVILMSKNRYLKKVIM